MKISDVLASFGVVVLLIAFVFNLTGKLPANSRWYSFCNFAGSAICCYSSFLIKFYPFVALEAIWSITALYFFIKVPRGTKF